MYISSSRPQSNLGSPHDIPSFEAGEPRDLDKFLRVNSTRVCSQFIIICAWQDENNQASASLRNVGDARQESLCMDTVMTSRLPW
jgi:hypothetical protein